MRMPSRKCSCRTGRRGTNTSTSVNALRMRKEQRAPAATTTSSTAPRPSTIASMGEEKQNCCPPSHLVLALLLILSIIIDIAIDRIPVPDLQHTDTRPMSRTIRRSSPAVVGGVPHDWSR